MHSCVIFQVRVAVHHSAINFADMLATQGKYQDSFPLPYTPGSVLFCTSCYSDAAITYMCCFITQYDPYWPPSSCTLLIGISSLVSLWLIISDSQSQLACTSIHCVNIATFQARNSLEEYWKLARMLVISALGIMSLELLALVHLLKKSLLIQMLVIYTLFILGPLTQQLDISSFVRVWHKFPSTLGFKMVIHFHTGGTHMLNCFRI